MFKASLDYTVRNMSQRMFIIYQYDSHLSLLLLVSCTEQVHKCLKSILFDAENRKLEHI